MMFKDGSDQTPFRIWLFKVVHLLIKSIRLFQHVIIPNTFNCYYSQFSLSIVTLTLVLLLCFNVYVGNITLVCDVTHRVTLLLCKRHFLTMNNKQFSSPNVPDDVVDFC